MDTEIALDYTAVARPLSLGRFLIEHRFNLTKIYLDVIDTDEGGFPLASGQRAGTCNIVNG